MPLIGKKTRRGPTTPLLALIAVGGAVAVRGKDVKRYLRMRPM